jgi:hypothetical protein
MKDLYQTYMVQDKCKLQSMPVTQNIFHISMFYFPSPTQRKKQATPQQENQAGTQNKSQILKPNKKTETNSRTQPDKTSSPSMECSNSHTAWH